MKRVWMVVLVLVLVGVVGCGFEKSADSKASEQTEKLMRKASAQTGMPNIVNFQQKKLMKMVYELCDKEDLICYAYLKSDYTGKLCFVGKCLGFGIPFSAQYTNPQRLVDRYGRPIDSRNYEPRVLPQPDPNGLFMPTSSSATWLMMIDPKTGEPRPVYLEPEIVVSPFQLH